MNTRLIVGIGMLAFGIILGTIGLHNYQVASVQVQKAQQEVNGANQELDASMAELNQVVDEILVATDENGNEKEEVAYCASPGTVAAAIGNIAECDARK